MTVNKQNKELKRKRIMSYFISAAIDIIEQDGIHNLSIRKAAERAGYNSATLYHYFSNLEELTLFASIKCLNEYALDFPKYLKKSNNMMEQYLLNWECFCNHSFRHPDIYQVLFFSPTGTANLADAFKMYYEIFPQEQSEGASEYEELLMEGDFYKRDYLALQKIIEEKGYNISEEDGEAIIEMNILIFRGMLAKMKDSVNCLSVKEAVCRTLAYMQHTFSSYNIK